MGKECLNKITTAIMVWKPLVEEKTAKSENTVLSKLEQKALDLKKKAEDSRSIGMVARDVHLMNIGTKIRDKEEQLQDRQFLQDCLACWDLLDIKSVERDEVERILMERYWLI